MVFQPLVGSETVEFNLTKLLIQQSPDGTSGLYTLSDQLFVNIGFNPK